MTTGGISNTNPLFWSLLTVGQILLVTVVLLTDGQSNHGLSYPEFHDRWAGKSAGGADPIRTFPILFGEASTAELDEIASLSGGRSFDARNTNLREVFREIRGYQ